MSDKDIKAILDSLMARRGNAPEFILELEGYVDDLANGLLDTADKKYIRDLAERLSKGGRGNVEIIDPAGEVIDVEEVDYAEEEAWDDTRFARAKAAFHARFNPDEIDPDAPDAAIRRELYEEFSAELDRIEDEG